MSDAELIQRLIDALNAGIGTPLIQTLIAILNGR